MKNSLWTLAGTSVAAGILAGCAAPNPGAGASNTAAGQPPVGGQCNAAPAQSFVGKDSTASVAVAPALVLLSPSLPPQAARDAASTTTPSMAVRRDTCPSMPEPAERKTEVLINMGNPRKTKPRVWEPRLTAV